MERGQLSSEVLPITLVQVTHCGRLLTSRVSTLLFTYLFRKSVLPVFKQQSMSRDRSVRTSRSHTLTGNKIHKFELKFADH